MKRFLSVLAVMLLAVGAQAAAPTLITATITITNTSGTTNGQTITVNGDTRTWTNSVIVPASQILTNNSIGGCATNLFIAVSDSPFLNLSLGQLTNGISLQTLLPNGPMSVSLSAGWGLVVLSTNTLTSAQVVRVPLSVEYSTNQTNIATYLAQGLESDTYALSRGAPFFSGFLSWFLGANNVWTGSNTNTNSFLATPILIAPISTNAVNYGNAFSSPGTNAFTEQFGRIANAAGSGANAFGSVASASGAGSLAVGQSSIASGANGQAIGSSSSAVGPASAAFGYFAYANGQNSTALGGGATASVDYSVAIGNTATAAGTNSTALGQGANASYNNSTAIGQGSSTAGTNQVVIGQASQWVSIPGNLNVSGVTSNVTFGATNTFPKGSDIAFGRFAVGTIANGNNAGVVVGTNVFVEVSGPTGAFTINGIAGGRDGKFLILLNRTGQNMTLANDSGVDPTAANRLYCLSGADKTTTGNAAAILIYSGAVTHWIVLNLYQ